MNGIEVVQRSDHYVTFIVSRDEDPRRTLELMNARIIRAPGEPFAAARTIWDVYPLPHGATQIIAWALPNDRPQP